MINAGVEPMDVEEVKGLLQATPKRGETGRLEVLQLRDEGSVVLLPASLENEMKSRELGNRIW